MKQSARLNLTLLGSSQIILDDEPLTGFVSAKAKALLCFFAVTRSVQSRNALVALFWGDVPEADAKSQLRIALSNLRKLVGDHLRIERETVAFDTTQNYRLDVQEFEKHLTDGKREIAGHNSQVALHNLQAAVREYRGDLLAGMLVRDAPEFEDWMLVQRERLRLMALDALWTISQLERANGNTNAALDALQRVLELEPWREEAHREVMLLLARTGKRSAALHQYESCRAVLARELGVEPASETVHLYERIRAARGLPRENLPPPSTSFVGRETELRTIAQRLQTETRLLTLLGPGGIGKTRLALQTAAQHIDQFLNGVFFVPLAEATHEDAIVLAIAQALQFTFSGSETPSTQVLNYLQDKELLLVLDNMEQAPNAAETVREILAHAPSVCLLVTTRERLNLRAEWLIVVEGLAVAALGAPSAAVQLFAERARQVASDFALELEANTVQHICALVGGMPLAIELAATWRRSFSAAEIAHQIQNDLNFLATTQRDVRPAHTSIRAVFEHSWKMLTAQERNVFRNLAIFHGDFTGDAARQVADVTPQILQSLADKSLVRVLPRDSVESTLRFGMHELLRQYAREKLEQARQAKTELSAKHAAFYADKLQAREKHLQGSNVKQAAMELARDRENITAAWEWACAQTPPHRTVLEQMTGALVFFLEMRAEYIAARRMYTRAIECMEANPAPDAAAEIIIARLCSGCSWFCFRLAEFEEGRRLSERAMTLLQKHDTWQYTAYPLLFLGASEFGAGHLQAARGWTMQSVEVFRRLKDAYGVAGALNNLGQMSLALGDLDSAEEYLRVSFETARRVGIKTLQCDALENLGGLQLQRGELELAQRNLEECLVLARELDSAYEIATTQNTLARVLFERGDVNRAAELVQEAESVWRRIGDKWSLARTLNQAADLELARGIFAHAEKLYVSALETAHAANATTMALNALAGLAELRVQRGDAETARRWFARIAQHEASEGQTRERAAQKFQALTNSLDADATESLRANAMRDTLDEIITRILQTQN